jgi:hypothetical protein
MPCRCKEENCRHTIKPSDVDYYAEDWDCLIKSVLSDLLAVPQPLINLVDTSTYDAVMAYLQTGKGYQSVRTLKHAGKIKHAGKKASDETVITGVDLDYPLASTT